jgi:hypothetical protein
MDINLGIVILAAIATVLFLNVIRDLVIARRRLKRQEDPNCLDYWVIKVNLINDEIEEFKYRIKSVTQPGGEYYSMATDENRQEIVDDLSITLDLLHIFLRQAKKKVRELS